MNWLWLNIPLMAVFFTAVAGIPLWLVLRRPDFGPLPAGREGCGPDAVAAHRARSLSGSAIPARPEAGRARISDDSLRYGWAGR